MKCKVLFLDSTFLVKGNCPACSIAEPFFPLPQEHEENKKPEKGTDAQLKTRQIKPEPRASLKNNPEIINQL